MSFQSGTTIFKSGTLIDFLCATLVIDTIIIPARWNRDLNKAGYTRKGSNEIVLVNGHHNWNVLLFSRRDFFCYIMFNH